MAVEAGAHAQRQRVSDGVHFVDLVMASYAAHSTTNMDSVVEEDIIRFSVHMNPVNGPAFQRAFAHKRQARVVSQHLVVAVHAQCALRNVRIPGLLYAGVAVSAVHAKLASMHTVAEADRLKWLVPHQCVFRSEIVPGASNRPCPHKKPAGYSAGAGNNVRVEPRSTHLQSPKIRKNRPPQERSRWIAQPRHSRKLSVAPRISANFQRSERGVDVRTLAL